MLGACFFRRHDQGSAGRNSSTNPATSQRRSTSTAMALEVGGLSSAEVVGSEAKAVATASCWCWCWCWWASSALRFGVSGRRFVEDAAGRCQASARGRGLPTASGSPRASAGRAPAQACDGAPGSPSLSGARPRPTPVRDRRSALPRRLPPAHPAMRPGTRHGLPSPTTVAAWYPFRVSTYRVHERGQGVLGTPARGVEGGSGAPTWYR